MMEQYRRRLLFFALLLFILFCPSVAAAAGTTQMETGNGAAGAEDIYNTIYDSIPLDEVETILQEMKDEGIEFSIQDYVRQVMSGNGELSMGGIQAYIGKYIHEQLEKNKSTFIRLILYGILSGIFLNFSTSMYEKQMGETGFHIIYFLAVTIIVGGFLSAFQVAGSVLRNVVDFMRALVPSFSMAVTWSTGSAASLAFYQTALYAIAIADNIMIGVFLPVVQVYFLLNVLNPLSNWRFTKFAALMRSFVRIGTKTLLAVMIGHQGIQGLIMPALDGVRRSSLFRAANSIPGVGNVFSGVTDTVIGTGVLIKSAVGVGGLAAVGVICLVPMLRLGVFTVVYRGLAAFAQPVTDKRLVSVYQSVADSGKLLLQLVFMTAVMFLVTLAIVIAATNFVL